MFAIRIVDLEVFYQVGVPDEERAEPQRLMITVELDVDAPKAALSDALGDTVDYYSVSQKLLHYGEGRSWKLLEKLSAELAEMILRIYAPARVRVEIKKFIIPETRHISVACVRSRASQV
jgi:dihydroneopterin aldolase